MASKKTPVQRRDDVVDNVEYIARHQPAVSNALRIKLDHLKTFEPLTENQKLFFDAYKIGDYFVALHGVACTGKTFCALYKALEEVLDKGNPF
jgi:predicted ribonuclease YlaK